MMCQRIGLLPISIIGFGLRPLSSLMRLPIPPARITAFMACPPRDERRRGGMERLPPDTAPRRAAPRQAHREIAQHILQRASALRRALYGKARRGNRRQAAACSRLGVPPSAVLAQTANTVSAARIPRCAARQDQNAHVRDLIGGAAKRLLGGLPGLLAA